MIRCEDIWLSYNEPMEGRCNFMYLDKLGLLTTGVGNLLSVGHAMVLDWRIGSPSGPKASKDEIRAEHAHISKLTDGKLKGGFWYKSKASLFLPEEAIDKMVVAKLRADYTRMVIMFPEMPKWPLDAEIAVMSMCWAMGSGAFGGFPKFVAHCKRQNFAEYALKENVYSLSSGAAHECWMKDKDNPGLTPRNRRNVIHFRNAQRVLQDGLDKDRMYWPADISVATAEAKVCDKCNGTGRL